MTKKYLKSAYPANNIHTSICADSSCFYIRHAKQIFPLKNLSHDIMGEIFQRQELVTSPFVYLSMKYVQFKQIFIPCEFDLCSEFWLAFNSGSERRFVVPLLPRPVRVHVYYDSIWPQHFLAHTIKLSLYCKQHACPTEYLLWFVQVFSLFDYILSDERTIARTKFSNI